MMRPVVLLVLLALLSGCGMFGGDDGYFRDRKDDYLQAKMLPPLTVPKDLHAAPDENLYAVPPVDVGVRRPTTSEVPQPPTIVAGETANMVKIQSIGHDEWILVRLYPGQVWPRIKDYLISHHIPIAVESGKRGIIETGWIKPGDDGGPLQRYRFTVRQGVQHDTTEIHLLQLAVPAGPIPKAVAWPEESSEYSREQAVLKEFANYLASTADSSAPVSLVAQDIDTRRRLYLVKNPQPAIRVNLSWERAVASTGYALGKAGFTITGKDTDKGVFEVTYDDSKHKPKRGFFRKMFDVITFAGLRHGKENNHFTVTLARGQQPGWVNIHLNGDKNLSSERRETLLSLIKEYLT